MQARVTEADGAEKVMEEVEERPPAEVCVFQWVSFSLENPVGWYLRNGFFLRLVLHLVVALGWCSRPHDCVR